MFARLIDEMRACLQNASQSAQTSFRIRQPSSGEIPLLEWLNTQAIYPKLYWRHRETGEETAACGATMSFDCLEHAQAFLDQHRETPTMPEIRLWGLNAFEQAKIMNGRPQKSALFLPKIEWRREESALTLICHLPPNIPRAQALHDTLTCLDQILDTQPLPPLNAAVQSVCHQPDYENWQQLVEKALREIAAGHFQKVVLARCSTLQLEQPLSPAAFLAASRAVNKHCYHFLYAFSPTQAFLGSSPERLYLRRQYALFTEAVAGTVANDPDDDKARQLADWLMHDPKNRHENQLVVDDICARLRKITSVLDVSPAHVIRLSKVQHLRRLIHAQLTHANDTECLQRLQPTAAVAGLPREAARRFILDEEPFARDWYAGTIGYFSQAQAEFAVTLRSALIENQRLSLYAGGGIVAGSRADEEWREVETKAESLRSLLTKSAA